MTFKRFMKGVFYFPAELLTALSRILFGHTEENKYDDEVKIKLGLLSLLLNTISWVFRSITDFVSHHKSAIALALWLTALAVPAAVATVYLWPAALAAVTGFSLYGVSIATLFGTSLEASLIGTGVVAAVLTSATVFTGAAIVNTINAVVDCLCKPKKQGLVVDTEKQDPQFSGSSVVMGEGLGTPVSRKNVERTETPPVQGNAMFREEPVEITTLVDAPISNVTPQ